MSRSCPTPPPIAANRAGRLLPFAQAQQQISEQAVPIGGHEDVLILDALGRVVALDVISPIDVPSHTNSALDGYAFRGRDLPTHGERPFRVIGTAWAGRGFRGAVGRNEAVRVMTGAAIPPGADSVVAQELVRAEGDRVHLGAEHAPRQNVRAAGEDIPKGSVALPAGKRIFPAELGLLASIGVERVKVKPRLRVAFFSTGDEIRGVGEPIEDGGVYDSNRFTLFGMLTRLGVETLDKGIIRDDKDAVRAALLASTREAHVVITSGGVSTGAADFVEEVLQTSGVVGFWRVSIKPGRPLAFGRIGRSLFFGLPGNPVAVMVTFYQFLQPALLKMMGETRSSTAPILKVRCESKLAKRRGRTEFYRAVLERGLDGELVVRKSGKQGSGILHSMSEANCFVLLGNDDETVEPGDMVEVQPFFGLV